MKCFNHSCQLFKHGDCVQLHLEAVNMYNPPYSSATNLSNMKAERSLDCNQYLSYRVNELWF